MKKAYVIVDAYSSGRMLPIAFREKLGDDPNIVLIHAMAYIFAAIRKNWKKHFITR